jgi:3D (Asp-Asp-Asp) domain-containing protein
MTRRIFAILVLVVTIIIVSTAVIFKIDTGRANSAQFATFLSPYVASGNGKQASVSAVITWYGFNDNSGKVEGDHRSALIAYPKKDGFRTFHNLATEGSGTFNDPTTFAVRKNDEKTFPIGSVIYVPMLQKYYIVEDLCGDTNGQGCLNGDHHVDLWMGPQEASGKDLLACQNKGTPGKEVQVTINPSPNLPVNRTLSFSKKDGCTLRTF